MFQQPRTQRQLYSSPPKENIKSQRAFPDFKSKGQYDPERFKMIEHEFNIIDSDGSGYLQKNELISYMQGKLGVQFNSQLVDEIFNEINVNQDNTISKEEFSHGYFNQEVNLRNRITEIEKSIYEDNQKMKEVKTQFDEVKTKTTDKIGHIQLSVLSGVIHTNFQTKEKLQKQVVLQLGFEDSVFGSVKKETKPSVSLENPIWNEKFDFYLKPEDGNFDLSITVFFISGKQRDQIYQTQYQKDLNHDTSLTDSLFLGQLGSVKIQYEFQSDYYSGAEKKIGLLERNINDKLELGIQCKQKLKFYQTLFGTMQYVNPISAEAIRNTACEQFRLSSANQVLNIPFQPDRQQSQAQSRSIQLSTPKPQLYVDKSIQNFDLQSQIPPPLNQNFETPRKPFMEIIFPQVAVDYSDEQTKFLKKRKIIFFIELSLIIASSLFRTDFFGCLTMMYILVSIDHLWNSVQQSLIIGCLFISLLFDMTWATVLSPCSSEDQNDQCGSMYSQNTLLWVYQIFVMASKAGFMIFLKEFNLKM